MFKAFVVIALCVLLIRACSADITILTMHVPLTDSSYVAYNIDGHRDIVKSPINLPLWHWSN